MSIVFGCPPTKSSPKISKFQNRPKRARYRIPARKLHGLPGTGPNITLEEFSRHDIAGASPERRPPPAAPPRKNAHGAKATLGRNIAHRLATHVASPCAHHSTTGQQGAQPAANLHRNMAPSKIGQRLARSGATSTDVTLDQRPSIVRTTRDGVAHEARRFASGAHVKRAHVRARRGAVACGGGGRPKSKTLLMISI
ncbi:hypothetical protein F511_43724 [Dorcoceras hygrometricum]|uniref:Uncharacterized protein n=1 Tax=Dorcoceras hygrometricum TaxID=472368 RepID=A0A2Z7B5M0_9LAMI|nr:hypothetical protein F511_43724 [Dorcoceras hygrometricum]